MVMFRRKNSEKCLIYQCGCDECVSVHRKGGSNKWMDTVGKDRREESGEDRTKNGESRCKEPTGKLYGRANLWDRLKLRALAVKLLCSYMRRVSEMIEGDSMAEVMGSVEVGEINMVMGNMNARVRGEFH